MAAPKRTKFEREHQLTEIQSMYLRGMRQADIADRLGISQSQVSRDLATIRDRWKTSQIAGFNELKNRELARLDELERTYWEAWERSLGERMKTRTERNTINGGDGQRDKASVEKETLLGNPSYLSGVKDCIEQRCKILGVFAAQKVDVQITKELNQALDLLEKELDSDTYDHVLGVLAGTFGGSASRTPSPPTTEDSEADQPA